MNSPILTGDYDANVGGLIEAAFHAAVCDAAFGGDVQLTDIEAAACTDGAKFDVELTLKATLAVTRYPNPRESASELTMLLRRVLWRADAELPYVTPLLPQVAADLLMQTPVEG